MYSRDQILLEQAYQQTAQRDKNCWCLNNVKQILQERNYKLGERTACKEGIVLELRESKTPYLHIKIVSSANKFPEITLGGSQPETLAHFTAVLEELDK